MSHLTEQDLVLHYYGEMRDAQERTTASHLSECGDCRREFTRLQRVLAAIDESAFATELPDGFERTVWARLEPNLRHQRGGWRSWWMLSPAPLVVAAAVLVLAAGAFFAGRLSSPATNAPSVGGTSADAVRERILLVDLGEHLDRSQMMLVELVSAEANRSLAVTGERANAEDLLAANRLYRQTAASTGDTAMSDLLDELERVLVELAAGPERLTAQELADVRKQIEAKGLLFRVRIVSSEVRERQKETLKQRTGQRS
jgi:hypothetical protein